MEQVEDTINRLSAEIEELTAILLDDPLAEDVFVLEMRSVANPRFYIHPELRIATDEGREERFSLRRLVLGMGQEEGAFGGLIDLRYDPTWKQPVREIQFSGQFRAWGNRSTPLGLALGGTYLSYNEDFELLSEGSYTGIEKDGESKFSPTVDEWEIYAAGIAKFPSRNSFVHVFLGSTQIQGAFQYFLKAPSFALISEAKWRYKDYKIDPRPTDSTGNNDFGSEKNRPSSNNVIFALDSSLVIPSPTESMYKLVSGTALKKKSFCLALDQVFKIRKTDGQWEQKNSIFQNRGSTL